MKLLENDYPISPDFRSINIHLLDREAPTFICWVMTNQLVNNILNLVFIPYLIASKKEINHMMRHLCGFATYCEIISLDVLLLLLVLLNRKVSNVFIGACPIISLLQQLLCDLLLLLCHHYHRKYWETFHCLIRG